MTITVVVAGATGWAGSAVARGLHQTPGFALRGAVARRAAGSDLGETLEGMCWGVPVTATVEEAMQAGPVDVLVDYTHPLAVKKNVEAALAAGVRAVIGTSGLSGADLEALGERAVAQGIGVIAAGNFSLTAALAKHFTLIAARYLRNWEVLDYANAAKVDAPSGTVRELAEALAAAGLHPAADTIPAADVVGIPATRGAQVERTRVHALRLPGLVLGFETRFGTPDESLRIVYQAGSSPAPYVSGTLLAVERVMGVTGLVRGLDHLLFDPGGSEPGS